MENYTQKNERLRQCRLQRSWRLSDVAEQLGTSVTTVQRWERGTQQPSLYYRAKLCELFGLTAQELGFADPMASLPLDESKEPLESSQAKSEEDLVLWTVPYARNPYFVGRDNLFSRLEQLFPASQAQATRPGVLPPPLALTGLGGIGKTQIALEYAYRVREQQPQAHILWITAANEETIQTSFVSIAHLLPGMTGNRNTDQQQLVAAVRRWLEQCQSPWLLVMDDANDFSLLQSYLPLYGNGKVLMTTRASAVGVLALPLAVDDLLPEEAIHFLLRRTHRFGDASAEEMTQARQIVEALSPFPLALDQAGAYIEETSCHFDTYLQLYQHHRQQLLARRGITSTHYPYSVATTWSLSFQYLQRQHPAAVLLLHLCAFLAPGHIPEELLVQGAEHWPLPLQLAVADPFTFNQMLQALFAFSLVKRLSSQKLLSLHSLVQTVQREQMDLEEQRDWAVRVVRALHGLFPSTPKDPATWPLCQRYLEQALACDTLIRHYQIQISEAADILDRTGTYLRERVLYPLAEPLYLQALRIREQQLGSNHPDTAQSLNNLALLSYKQGRYAQAEPLYQRALLILEQQLGPDHLDLAYPLHGLGNLYHQQDRYVEAEQLFQRALSIREQQLGPDHPQVAYPLNNLALLYYKQGKYEQAEPLYQHALSIREQQLGPDHPDIANSLTLLGLLYYKQGRYKQAEPLFQRALSIREQQLGPDHPDMVYPLIDLANLYSQQGKDEQAEPLALRAQHIAEQQVGPDHLLIAFPLTVLGNLYREQGKYEQAEQLFLWALRVREQQLGPDHSQMAYPLHGLANLYHQQGREAEAEQLYQHALRIREHLLGPKHIETADVLHDFAGFQLAQNHIPEATHLYQRALIVREHVLGADHPLTSDTRRHLYTMLVNQAKQCK